LALAVLNLLIASHPLEEELYLALAKSRLMLYQYDLATHDYERTARLGRRWLELDGRQGVLYKNFLESD
jgi:hypothetical protein